MRAGIIFGFLMAVMAVTIVTGQVACSNGDDDDDDDVDSFQQGLVRCEDCDDVLEWVRLVATESTEKALLRNLEDTIANFQGGGWYDDDWDSPDDGGWDDDDFAGDDDGDDDGDAVSDDDAADDDGAPPDDGESDGGDDDRGDDDETDHSDTNTQESDVDEADIVKVENDLIYMLAGGELLIFDPLPAETTRELSRLDILGRTLELFIWNTTAIVFSETRPNDLPDNVWPGTPRGELAPVIMVLTIIDASDPSDPEVIRTMYVEGTYISSRRIGRAVRIATVAYPPGPQIETWVDPYLYYQDGELDEQGLRDAYDRLMAENREAIENTPLEAWLPRFFEVTGDTQRSGLLSNCYDYFHPLDPLGRAVSSVLTVYMDNPLEKQPDIGLLADGQQIYSSSKALYIAGAADTAYEWGGSSALTSMIHKFTLGEGDAQAQYVGSGEVEGFVLNQFSMGEYEDYLRVVTTTGWWGDGGLANHVYVLAQGDRQLDVVGEIRDIAPGEELKSARFMGRRGYLVTFEQTDPLFTLDMSDPRDPRLVGELQIPGFSTYIHPFGNDHILTIGENGNEWASTGGVLLQIFDISNFAYPFVAYSQVVAEGWDAYSEALYDHKAFLYYEPMDLLAIPVVDYGWDSWGDDDWGWGDDDWWGGEDDWGDGGETEPDEPPDPTDDDDIVVDDDADDDVAPPSGRRRSRPRAVLRRVRVPRDRRRGLRISRDGRAHGPRSRTRG
ncbi:MAG: beta-propeller domain-containing protein [Deltaproteobacteria bacterium]|nr:beta-propeller domain-containing protein [Deltaproteobacteria bacterium]